MCSSRWYCYSLERSAIPRSDRHSPARRERDMCPQTAGIMASCRSPWSVARTPGTETGSSSGRAMTFDGWRCTSCTTCLISSSSRCSTSPTACGPSSLPVGTSKRIGQLQPATRSIKSAVVSCAGAVTGAETGEWLSAGHRLAKTVTNCVINRWGEGPDSPHGVRARLAQQDDPGVATLLERVDDETIAIAIRGVRDVQRHWQQTPPGGTLRLSWPLSFRRLEQLAARPTASRE